MSIATIEQNYAVAVQESGGGTAVAGDQVKANPCRGRRRGNITAFIFTLAVSLMYGAMMVLGAIYFHACSDTRMALYTVVQGVTAMVNTGMFAFWLICRCISYKPVFAFGLFIFLFNLVWCIVGAVWIANSPCKDINLYWYAVGFSIPIWFLLFIICCCTWCCRSKDDD